MIESQINRLNGKIIGFSDHVKKMLKNSIKGLLEKDIKLLDSVIENDEHVADNLDKTIEKHSIAAIAQFSPKAYNLRSLLMILKMNNDLERIADHCVKICYTSKKIFEKNVVPGNNLKEIKNMADETGLMLNDSINSFIEENIDKAKKVCKADEVVDKYQRDIISMYTKIMKKDNSMIDWSLTLIEIANNLERIADLSTNLAEDIVFIIKGKVIKH